MKRFKLLTFVFIYFFLVVIVDGVMVVINSEPFLHTIFYN